MSTLEILKPNRLADEPIRSDLSSSLAAGPDASTGAGSGEWLGFQLGEEHYGVDILQVQEIRSYERPTRVTGTDPSVLGVLNLRGVIVPVIDLRVRVGATPRFDAQTMSIVLNLSSGTTAVVVDSVSDVRRLDIEEVKRAPEMKQIRFAATAIQGLAKIECTDGPRLQILLDIDNFLRAK